MYKSKYMQVGLPAAPAESGQPGVLSYLKSKDKESGRCIPKYFGSSSAMGNFQPRDFFSVPVRFYCLNPASPTPQLGVCP